MCSEMSQRTQITDAAALDLKGFEAELDERILRAAGFPGASLAEVTKKAGGAFPTLVADRLRAHGLDLRTTATKGAREAEEFRGPELHAADFEWYFTDACARELAVLLRPRHGPPLLFGAPTVAAALAGSGARAVAVDRSPFLRERFGSRFGDLHPWDLRRPLGILRAHQVVFFDAPWYFNHIARWLWQASVAVQRGGTIAFALFGPTTRPRAQSERDQLLMIAERLGDVSVIESALEYRTPGFEAVALAAAGHDLSAPWRAGDLVLIQDVRGHMSVPAVPREPDWATHRRGDVVIKVRNDLPRETIDWDSSFVADTVARSHFRRLSIAAWTSRHRIVVSPT